MSADDHAVGATLPLFPAEIAQGGIVGRDVAEQNADPGWLEGTLSAIAEMARTGEPFQAADVKERFGLAEPDHHCRWGAVFAAAHRAGVIRKVGAAQSRRKTVHRSLTSMWIGANDTLPTAGEAA